MAHCEDDGHWCPNCHTAAAKRKGGKVKAIVGHVCFYCHHVFDQTKDNPSRTDFCVKCGHRGEGIKRTLEKRDWGILHVVPNAEAHGRRSRTVQPLVGSLDGDK